MTEYQNLQERARLAEPSFVEHILAAPKRPPEIPDDEELFPRERFRERAFDFEGQR